MRRSEIGNAAEASLHGWIERAHDFWREELGPAEREALVGVAAQAEFRRCVSDLKRGGAATSAAEEWKTLRQGLQRVGAVATAAVTVSAALLRQRQPEPDEPESAQERQEETACALSCVPLRTAARHGAEALLRRRCGVVLRRLVLGHAQVQLQLQEEEEDEAPDSLDSAETPAQIAARAKKRAKKRRAKENKRQRAAEREAVEAAARARADEAEAARKARARELTAAGLRRQEAKATAATLLEEMLDRVVAPKRTARPARAEKTKPPEPSQSQATGSLLGRARSVDDLGLGMGSWESDLHRSYSGNMVVPSWTDDLASVDRCEIWAEI